MLTFITIQIISENDAMDGHGGAEKDQSKLDQRSLSLNNSHNQAGNPYIDLPSLELQPRAIEAATKTET